MTDIINIAIILGIAVVGVKTIDMIFSIAEWISDRRFYKK